MPTSTTVDVGELPGARGEEPLVALLPHERFPRRCDGELGAARATSAAVEGVHCYTDKNGDAKKRALRDHGAWVLRDDWRDAPAAPGGFHAWLATLAANAPPS